MKVIRFPPKAKLGQSMATYPRKPSFLAEMIADILGVLAWLAASVILMIIAWMFVS